jgi:hypothetical protein
MSDNLQEWQEAKVFCKLLTETEAGLKTIKPGNEYAIRSMKMFKQYGEEVAIEVCKLFIDINSDYYLSNNYKYIKRNKA